MAIPTSINAQITDAVTQANIKPPIGDPAGGMDAAFQALAHSVGILYENAVSAQEQMNVSAQAATNQGLNRLYNIDAVADAVATTKPDQGAIPEAIRAMLNGSKASP